MGRKKKNETVEIPEEEKKPALGGDAKRGILAVFLVALTILFLLSFLGQAGSFGMVVNKFVSLAVGWNRWILIFLLPLIAYLIVRRHETSLSDVIKYTGLGFTFFAFLGLSHLLIGDSEQELRQIAASGSGGGFTGYALASGLDNVMGKVAAFVVLLSFFICGVIAAFNVSLLHWFERIFGRFQKNVSDGDASSTDIQTVVQSTQTLPSLTQPDMSLPVDPLEPSNVQNIRFADVDEEPVQKREKSNAGEEETVLVPAFIRPKRSRFLYRWEFPPLELLGSSDGKGGGGDIEQNKEIIIRTLKHFGVDVDPGEVQVGPTVTQYTFRPAIGVKLSRITTLHNDLALALAAHTIRIEAPIPGRSLIGIEVPNKAKVNVRLREFLQTREFLHEKKSNLTLALGQDVSGRFIYADLGRMPHLLIAGTTRSGKSVCINSLLLTLLYQNSPEDLKLILVDPKRVELSLYNGIPHLKTDVIVDNHRVVNALKWAVSEMEQRYKTLEAIGSRDLESYRQKVLQGEKRRIVDPETNVVREETLTPLPQIVIVIDEMADLMVAHGKEVEATIIRLAQMARAVGIHLILATQRPEVNVITGLIKANMPARISFQLKSQIDSRTILDTSGAEKLLGNGDMLYSSAESSNLQRIQGVYVSEDEVKRVVNFLKQQKEEKGLDEIGEDFGGDDMHPLDLDGSSDGGAEENDPIYESAKRLVVETQRASTTYLQTYLKIGYPKAARVMQLLEKNGVVGSEVNKRREVLMKTLEEGKQYGDDPIADQAERDTWQM